MENEIENNVFELPTMSRNSRLVSKIGFNTIKIDFNKKASKVKSKKMNKLKRA